MNHLKYESYMLQRPRRNRKTAAIRGLLQEQTLSPGNIIAPIFVLDGCNCQEIIETMPGVYRLSIDRAIRQAEQWHARGILAVALFPVIDPALKTNDGSEALREEGLIPEAIRLFKRHLPNMVVITDIALDPFTSHGHDGLIDENGYVINDTTVTVLAEMAALHAACGADLVAPSDMMDGRVRAIRQELDQKGFINTGILAYTAKYASSLYSPFREALRSSLQFGDKKSYQMNGANSREAIRELFLDEEEGADIVMVKPALFYLDIIAKMRSMSQLPIAAYHVSGEYAMVMAAHERGMLNADAIFYEAAMSIRRAGADLIITYAVDSLLTQLSLHR